MEVKKITKQEPYGYTRLIEQVVNHNAEVLEKVLNRLEKLEEWVSEEKPIENEELVQSEDMAEDVLENLNERKGKLALLKARAEIEQVKVVMNEEIIKHDRKDLINFVNGLNQSLMIIDRHKAKKENE